MLTRTSCRGAARVGLAAESPPLFVQCEVRRVLCKTQKLWYNPLIRRNYPGCLWQKQLMKRWTVRDRYGNDIYLTQERWEHIVQALNHPEMLAYESHLQETIQSGHRNQDPLNPQKYRYVKAFADLAEDNTHIVAIVLFRFSEGEASKPVLNNYIVTAYQKEIR